MGHVYLASAGFGGAVASAPPALVSRNPVFLPEHVRPAQRQKLGCAQGSRGTDKDEDAVERIGKALDNVPGLLGRHEDGLVVSGEASLEQTKMPLRMKK